MRKYNYGDGFISENKQHSYGDGYGGGAGNGWVPENAFHISYGDGYGDGDGGGSNLKFGIEWVLNNMRNNQKAKTALHFYYLIDTI